MARNNAYKKRIIDFNAEPLRVEGHGAAGDILIWHRLLAHTAGWNRSPRIQLRESVLCDYWKRESTLPESGQSHADMWHAWSHEVRSLRTSHDSFSISDGRSFRTVCHRMSRLILKQA